MAGDAGHGKTIKTGYGTHQVGCRGGSRYVDGFMVLWLYGFVVLWFHVFMVLGSHDFAIYGFMVSWSQKVTNCPFHVC